MSRHSLFFALALVLGCPTAKSDDTAVVPDDTSGADDTAPPTDSDDSGPRDSGPTDADDDGYPAAMDCDDTDAAVHPDAAERCNGRDDDCDGVADEDGVDGGPWYADADGDGYGDPAAGTQTECEAPAGYGADGSDCDDADASQIGRAHV